jgi:hypothetical protein
VKSFSTGCFGLKSTLGRFLKKSDLERIFGISLKIKFFCQAAPIELIWAKIAWTVEKLFMVLFKLEIPIPSPFWGFGESESIGSFWKHWDLKRHFVHAGDRVVWRIDRRNRPSRFCRVRRQETNKMNEKWKKLTQSLYVDPSLIG